MSRIKITSQSFLVQNFHEFFNLLLRQKEYALRSTEMSMPLAADTKKTKDGAPLSTVEQSLPTQETQEEETQGEEIQEPQIQEQSVEQVEGAAEIINPLVNTIQRRLSLLLEEQALESTVQVGEFAVSSFQEALYAMVAYADEVFLNLPWNGQKQWEDNLLESRFFQTQIAGELIFDQMDDLLRNNDPMKADLAMIYLTILGLGFQGKYRADPENRDQLALYRQQLYIMVNRHPSTLYEPGRPHLIPGCYEHVLDSTISRGLPEIRVWLLTFVGILSAYLFVSTLLWYKFVKDMDGSLGNILNQAQQIGLS